MIVRKAVLGAVYLSSVALGAGCGGNAAGMREAPTVAVDSGPAAAAALPADQVVAGDAVVTGTLTYRQRIALPRGALIVVSLVDLADPGRPIAERRFTAASQVPIRFELPYESARLQGGRFYGVFARVFVDGAPWFANDQPVPISAPRQPEPVQLVLRPAGSAGR